MGSAGQEVDFSVDLKTDDDRQSKHPLKTVLIVDDDDLVREMLSNALEREEYAVIEAQTPEQAEALASSRLDLALVEYVLKGSDGFAVIKALRQQQPDLPVILMTAYSNESLVVQAVRSGVTNYLKKPFSTAYLLKIVGEILGIEKAAPDRNDLGARDDFMMEGICRYIEEHYREKLNLDKVAHFAGMNRFKLCRTFRQKLGLNFVSFLNGVRLRNALELLQNTDLNITEISCFVGYGSVVHFDRVFKQVYAISPRDFRKRVRQSA